MRFSLVDLLIYSGSLLASIFGSLYLVGETPMMAVIGVATVFCVFIVVVLCPLFYRRFRLLPLRLPECPHCRRTPYGYQAMDGAWPNIGVRCGQCDGRLWLAFDRRTTLPVTGSEQPLLVLQWPENLGFWKRA